VCVEYEGLEKGGWGGLAGRRENFFPKLCLAKWAEEGEVWGRVLVGMGSVGARCLLYWQVLFIP